MKIEKNAFAKVRIQKGKQGATNDGFSFLIRRLQFAITHLPRYELNRRKIHHYRRRDFVLLELLQVYVRTRMMLVAK